MRDAVSWIDWRLCALGAVVALTTFSAPARAVPDGLDGKLELNETQNKRVGGDGLRDGWWRDHLALRLRGLEYRSEFVFQRQTLRFRLSGPLVKGSPGLKLELLGWAWRGSRAEFSAYGSAKRQGFKLKVGF